MENNTLIRLKSISEFHRLRGLPLPEHPLISVVDYGKIVPFENTNPISMVFDYYTISVKRGVNTKMYYGQQQYDFDEGIMFFMAPGQVLRVETDPDANSPRSGWMLLIHPDFLWNTPMAKLIRKYEFFSYSVNEALFLSEKEENTLNGIVQNIRQEYHSNIDRFSQNIIIAHLEVLLTYSERFYQRQFITRKIANHQVLDRLEIQLDNYFNNNELLKKGLPTVQEVAESLNISPGYLTGLLKVLTGQSTQQYIHQKLIEKAKEMLSVTSLSVSEIAYGLGFEHSQSFSKLFKSKTQLSPLEFRHSFQ